MYIISQDGERIINLQNAEGLYIDDRYEPRIYLKARFTNSNPILGTYYSKQKAQKVLRDILTESNERNFLCPKNSDVILDLQRKEE